MALNLNQLSGLAMNYKTVTYPPIYGSILSIGAIPSEIGNLTALKELYLNNNQLSGSSTTLTEDIQ